jgi:cytochrome d ubiquinol oxidase subunit I
VTQLLLAVDPVPWARAQMAFTLATHIILVPLGVSWAFMALVANHRAIKKNDADALELAQRWSKYMAVTFAVGAVTGTVLTFEFGLLWPNFMDRYGAAFGIPFAIEGLFFFTEAIFIAIYIYGWKRLPGWAHFWSGVPIVIAGLGGAASVVAANSWITRRLVLTRRREVAEVQPLDVIFNQRSEAAHMLVAATVGGSWSSVYAAGTPRGRRDRYHRLGFTIVLTVAATPHRSRCSSATGRYVYNNEWRKFAATSSHQTADDVPDPLRYLNDDGTVSGASRSRAASRLSDPTTGRDTVVGADSFPRAAPRYARVNTVHPARDVMVLLGSLLMLLSVCTAVWLFKRRIPEGSGSGAASLAGVAPSCDGGLGGHRGAASRGSCSTTTRSPGRDHQRRRVAHVPRDRRPLCRSASPGADPRAMARRFRERRSGAATTRATLLRSRPSLALRDREPDRDPIAPGLTNGREVRAMSEAVAVIHRHHRLRSRRRRFRRWVLTSSPGARRRASGPAAW